MVRLLTYFGSVFEFRIKNWFYCRCRNAVFLVGEVFYEQFFTGSVDPIVSTLYLVIDPAKQGPFASLSVGTLSVCATMTQSPQNASTDFMKFVTKEPACQTGM